MAASSRTDVLADVLSVYAGNEKLLAAETIVDRLAVRHPHLYAGINAHFLGRLLRQCGVDSVMTLTKGRGMRRGYRLDAVYAAVDRPGCQRVVIVLDETGGYVLDGARKLADEALRAGIARCLAGADREAS